MSKNFIKISEKYLPTLDVNLQEYRHNRTGAMHYHFASPKAENVFMVALRTMPHDSTGVAHILEHTALCGSRNFPTRDPFFGMLRRSMQTFMNAFTSSDWTAYPFATENKKDFYNLLRVYLDAVFFPNLNRLDFLQEGHRFEFDEDENLVIKGVVFNEMKGVYGNIYSRLYEINKSLLQPETTYHYDSGGYPQAIPNLDYESFLAFHEKHYHPTNATFFTFGDIPAEEHHKNFEELALKYFESYGEKVLVNDETRYLSPIRTIQGYPSTDTENPNQVHILFSWLLGKSNNAKTFLENSVLYSYLLEHSASPLRYALENAEFVASVSPLTMLDNSGRELRFTTGIVTNDAKYADETEKLIFDVLQKVAKDGIPSDEAIGIIDQIEMSLRELNTGYPYGLSLMLQAIGAATHEDDIANMLDPTELLAELRQKIQNPKYLAEILEKNIIKNSHFVRLTAVPDVNAVEVEQNLEKNFCENALQKMSDDDKEQILIDMQLLPARQSLPPDNDILPKITLSDIPKENKKSPKGKNISKNHTHYSVATNNLGYINKFFPLSGFKIEEISLLSKVAGLFGELGYSDKNYTETQKEIAKTLNIGNSLLIHKNYGEKNLRAYMMPSCRFLTRNLQKANDLYNKMIVSARFDEIEHIRTIFDEKLLSVKSALTENGQRTAMLRASSGFTLQAQIMENLGGISGMQNLKNFIKKSDEEIVTGFTDIYQKTLKNSPIILTVGTDTNISEEEKNIDLSSDFIEENFTPYKVNEAWLSDLAVGYCSLAIKTVPVEHKDAPLFVLLAQFLRDGFLHSAIREKGGAYGSGATYDPASESFRFFSYRDPRIEGTFQDFEKSLTWLLENNHSEQSLEEAKIGIIAKIDIPASPAKEAQNSFLNELRGYNEDVLNLQRKIILEATIDDLKRIVRDYLSDFSSASRVVLTGKQNKKICEKMGFEIHQL